MKVKMLAATYWYGKNLKAGDTPDVDNVIGERWIKAGIAEKAAAKPPKNTSKE